MFHRPIRILFLIMNITIFSGCATTPPPPTQWLTHLATVEKINTFTVTGKVGFIGNNERFSANFYWQQKGDTLSLRLTNFLGGTLLKLDVTPKQAVLVDRDGISHSGKNAPSLLRQLTGVALPVNDLLFWIKGIPAPNNQFELGEDKRLSRINENKTDQQGWQVDFLTYDSDTNNLLPSSLTLKKQDQEVKLHISQWEYTL